MFWRLALSHTPSPELSILCPRSRIYSQGNLPKGLHLLSLNLESTSPARLLQQPPCHSPSPGSQACRSKGSEYLERGLPRCDPMRLANHSSSLSQTPCIPVTQSGHSSPDGSVSLLPLHKLCPLPGSLLTPAFSGCDVSSSVKDELRDNGPGLLPLAFSLPWCPCSGFRSPDAHPTYNTAPPGC